MFKSCLPFLFRKRKLCQVNILFIDDEHEEFDIIKTLADSREYGSVHSMADLDNLDNPLLKNADIIFLDVRWIWKKMHLANWTSLVDRINSKYPEKIINVYSSLWLPKDSHIKSWVKTIPKNSTHETFSAHIKTLWEEKK